MKKAMLRELLEPKEKVVEEVVEEKTKTRGRKRAKEV